MIYKGSRDGFEFKDYFSKVKNKGYLLSIIKTEFNKVFGCYIEIKRTNIDEWERDHQAFLFSLTYKKKLH